MLLLVSTHRSAGVIQKKKKNYNRTKSEERHRKVVIKYILILMCENLIWRMILSSWDTCNLFVLDFKSSDFWRHTSNRLPETKGKTNKYKNICGHANINNNNNKKRKSLCSGRKVSTSVVWVRTIYYSFALIFTYNMILYNAYDANINSLCDSHLT